MPKLYQKQFVDNFGHLKLKLMRSIKDPRQFFSGRPSGFLQYLISESVRNSSAVQSVTRHLPEEPIKIYTKNIVPTSSEEFICSYHLQPLPNSRVVHSTEIHCISTGSSLVRDLSGRSYSYMLRGSRGVPQQTNRASSRVSTQSQIQAKQLPSTSTSSKCPKSPLIP